MSDSDMDLRDLIRNLRERPRMYVPGGGFDEIVAFLLGRDSASGELTGFREFLVLRAREGDNLTFWALVQRIADAGGQHRPLTEADEPHAVDTLCDLLEEFLAEMRWSGARERLFHEYWVWQASRTWYDPDLVRYGMSPARASLTVDEAAEHLGMTRGDVFDLIAGWKLTPRREGDEVRLLTTDVERYRTETAKDGAAHRVGMSVDLGGDG